MYDFFWLWTKNTVTAQNISTHFCLKQIIVRFFLLQRVNSDNNKNYCPFSNFFSGYNKTYYSKSSWKANVTQSNNCYLKKCLKRWLHMILVVCKRVKKMYCGYKYTLTLSTKFHITATSQTRNHLKIVGHWNYRNWTGNES